MQPQQLNIRSAQASDCDTILQLIRALAEYEKLAHEVVATVDQLRATLFGANKFAEVLIGEWERKPVAYALFFHNYSTFLAKPGIYLEDLFVLPEFRSKGIGFHMLKHLAQLAAERDCGRLEWSVLDWNEPAIQFYKKLGSLPQSEWTVYRLTGQALLELPKSEKL
jgi:GNAT superfamily N-acetyltransferase